MITTVTETELGRYLWVPFNLPETRLQPNVEQTVNILNLLPGQQAKLAWLSVHLIRVLVLNGAPTKINAGYASAYAGLYANRADTLAGPPGEPLAYAGTDIPGTIGTYPPHQAWPINEADTYGVFVVNNLSNPPIDVSVSGAWLIHI